MFIIDQANPQIKLDELQFHKLNSTTLLWVCTFIFLPLIRISSGGEQSDVFLNIIFEDKNGERFKVENVRAIYYVPAPDHPRPNSELRFTFRNQEIFEMLSERDILEFKRSEEPAIWFIVRQIEPNDADYDKVSKGKNFDNI